MKTITIEVELTRMTCPNCAGVYAITQVFIDECLKRGNFLQMWACPYCHQQRGYGESVHDKEKRALQEQLARAQNEARMNAEQVRAIELSRNAAKSALTKERHRTSNGVCPCCQRSFTNLRRHMKTKHPERLTK